MADIQEEIPASSPNDNPNTDEVQSHTTISDAVRETSRNDDLEIELSDFVPDKMNKGKERVISEKEFVTTDLIFKDVTVKYGDTTILKNVSGLGQQGKLLAIMGPSG